MGEDLNGNVEEQKSNFKEEEIENHGYKIKIDENDEEVDDSSKDVSKLSKLGKDNSTIFFSLILNLKS